MYVSLGYDRPTQTGSLLSRLLSLIVASLMEDFPFSRLKLSLKAQRERESNASSFLSVLVVIFPTIITICH